LAKYKLKFFVHQLEVIFETSSSSVKEFVVALDALSCDGRLPTMQLKGEKAQPPLLYT
jgi:hypothetical protein